MARARFGRIVCVSSVAAVLGNRGQVNYAAAKSALHGAAKSLAREMASRGITVNVVAPGVIAGRMADAAFDAEQIKQLVPAGRAGTPQEVAALIAFLCSDRRRLHQWPGDRCQRRHGLAPAAEREPEG